MVEPRKESFDNWNHHNRLGDMKIKVSQLIVKYMESLGIKYIFGMPGAHILPVYDSLYASTIQAILAKHEQGAAFMAGGYTRASGKISACIATAGPGATNLVTGVANAYADKQPILVITGETPTHIFGKGGLQESSGEGGSIDQNALFKGITRYNKIVERTDYLAHVLNQASRILLSSNAGPVLLSFPYNVQSELVDESILGDVKTEKIYTTMYEQSNTTDVLTDLILEARDPVIVGGYGCIKSGAQGSVARLSEIMDIPVATSLKGKGVIDEYSKYSLGSLGVTSNGSAYQYIAERADLVILLGASFNERTSYLWDKTLLKNKKVVQIDSDYEQLEKVYRADIAIHGDIHEVLAGVIASLEKRGYKKGADKELHGNPLTDVVKKENPIIDDRFSLIEKFYSKMENNFPDGVSVFDDNIIFAQNFFKVSSQDNYYPNSGISSLGHAIPAAIGARFAGRRTIFAILGDGGFQMCCMEIMTAVNYNIPLNIVVLNNSTMGLIRKNQFQQYNERYISCDFVNPDYEWLSKSFGINYKRILSEQDLIGLFSSMDFENAVNLIEIVIDKDIFPNYSSKR